VNKRGRLSVWPQEMLTAQFGLTKGWLISSGFLFQMMCRGIKIRCFFRIQYHIKHKYKTTDACVTGLETNMPYHARQTSQHAERKNGIHIHTAIFQKRKTGKKMDSHESTISQHKLNSIEADVPCGLLSVWPPPPRIDRIGVAWWILMDFGSHAMRDLLIQLATTKFALKKSHVNKHIP